MKDYLLKTRNLTKNYKLTKALNNFSISLEKGKIYGLIGQNGAGKTTLMKLITGLSFPTTGTIELFGKTTVSDLTKERSRIGSMIEYPGFLPSLTAEENLTYRRLMLGIPDKGLENELLNLVGLTGTEKKKTQDFSLGMKQRLGIALALISNPELLILDEPINGLDPTGVVEIRRLLIRLCEERHITILISSHNLPELYQTATDFIFIHKGDFKKALSKDALDEACRKHLIISCSTPEKLAGVLEMNLGTKNYKVLPDKQVKLYDYADNPEKVAQVLFESGIVVTHLAEQGENLENYFITLIEGKEYV